MPDVREVFAHLGDALDRIGGGRPQGIQAQPKRAMRRTTAELTVPLTHTGKAPGWSGFGIMRVRSKRSSGDSYVARGSCHNA